MKHLIAIIAVSLMLAPAARAQETLPSLVVMADSTLSLPLSFIVRNYAREKQASVALELTESPEISGEIAGGSSADVLITLRANWLDQLKQQGLIDIYSQIKVVGDRLAFVGPGNSTLIADLDQRFPTGKMLMLMGADPMFVMPNPADLPEGRNAREALRHMKADADLESYTVYLKQRRQMHKMIRTQGAYGLLLATDAQEQGLNVLDLVPETQHSPIDYNAVVLAGENMDQARRFVQYLKSAAATKVFRDFGLSIR